MNRGVEPHLHLTVAWSRFGRPSLELQEEIDAADLAPVLAATTRASSTLPQRQKTTGAARRRPPDPPDLAIGVFPR
jgi:hypothetical protein